MAKRGQHSGDAHDYNVSHGHNDPSKSMTITAGTPKKHETYAEQARRHEDPGRPAQAAKNDWNEDTRASVANTGSTRARHPRSGRSGSDSNA